MNISYPRYHDSASVHSTFHSPIAILGCGTHAAVIKELCLACGYTIAAFLVETGFSSDRNVIETARLIEIGEHTSLKDHLSEIRTVALAIGHNDARLRWARRLLDEGYELPVLIHPRSFVSPSAVLAHGTVIGAGASIQASVHIGTAGLINTAAIVDHHGTIGPGSHIAPGAILAGQVKVGECALIGAGAVIRDRIVIGTGSTVGAGAVVVRDVDAFSVVVGIPAKQISICDPS